MSEDRLPLAIARVWAAAVRDREGIHAGVADEQSRLAGTLCALLDLRDGVSAANLRTSLEESILTVARALIEAGVTAPALEERP